MGRGMGLDRTGLDGGGMGPDQTGWGPDWIGGEGPDWSDIRQTEGFPGWIYG